ncbi:MAG: archease [Desulfobacca sp.]|uniref:archease n=1 Tax=Desulfobacca sp. TaxID=2067990 RepID=UPI00404932FC
MTAAVRAARRAGFRALPHTADAAFKLWGPTLTDIFIQGALALTALMTDRRRVRARQSREVTIEAGDPEMLLVAWLNHLLYLYDTESFLARTIQVQELTPTCLRATLRGEPLDPQRHVLQTGVKAATYHQLSISRTPTGWEGRIVFDL